MPALNKLHDLIEKYIIDLDDEKSEERFERRMKVLRVLVEAAAMGATKGMKEAV